MHRSQFFRIFQDGAESAGLPRAKRHPHVLKRSLASHLVAGQRQPRSCEAGSRTPLDQLNDGLCRCERPPGCGRGGWRYDGDVPRIGQLKPQLCVYCNRALAETVDHIPPKLLLAKPYPDNLLTVPSCLKCNSAFQKDDEYTRIIASIDLRNAGHQTVKANMPAILRSLQRSEALDFSRHLARRTTPTTVLGMNGKPLGQLVEVEQGRLNATGERIVRGLHFVETKLPVAASARVRVASIPGVTSPEPQAMIQQIARRYGGSTDRRERAIGDVFNYVAAFHPDFSVWLLILYAEFAWAATITTRDAALTSP